MEENFAREELKEIDRRRHQADEEALKEDPKLVALLLVFLWGVVASGDLPGSWAVLMMTLSLLAVTLLSVTMTNKRGARIASDRYNPAASKSMVVFVVVVVGVVLVARVGLRVADVPLPSVITATLYVVVCALGFGRVRKATQSRLKRSSR